MGTFSNAEFAIEAILTKAGELSVSDVRILQTALIENGSNKIGGGRSLFDSANGTFGPGTSNAVLNYLNDPEKLHLISRVSKPVLDNLSAQGRDGDLQTLRGVASTNGYDKLDLSGESVASLISKPYALNEAEIVTLKSELFEANSYRPHDHEFIKRADNGQVVLKSPTGVIDSRLLTGISTYIQSNRGAVLENPGLIKHMKGLGDYTETLEKEMISTSLVGRVVELGNEIVKVELSSANYRVQNMLYTAGYLGKPSGDLGDKSMEALERFHKDNAIEVSLSGVNWGAGEKNHESAPEILASEHSPTNGPQ